MHKVFVFSFVLLWLCLPVYSQEYKQEYPVNFGLRVRQPDSVLPKSKAKPVAPQRVAKAVATAILKPTADNVWELTGGWELTDDDQVTKSRGSIFDDDYDTSLWYNAVVPGTVLTTLVEAGVYPDPYYGLNNLAIPDDLCRKEWWYRIRFDAPKKPCERVWLTFDGINYRADIWLNGDKIGTIAGAFAEGRFDISDFITESNVLAVKIYPPNNPGIPHEQSPKAGRGPNGGQLCFDGPTFLSSEGWDWIPGIRDRNIGIWQGVYLKCTGDITLRYPKIVTDLPLPSTDHADVSVEVDVTNHSDVPKMVSLKGSIDDDTAFEYPVSLDARETRTVKIPVLRVESPRLWWPNGYGGQNMYRLHLSAYDGDSRSDKLETPFGIRELSYELSVLSETAGELRIDYSPTNDRQNGVIPFTSAPSGKADKDNIDIARLLSDTDLTRLNIIEKDGAAPYLVIRCNGQRIFCRGGNWGMDDGMKRVSPARLKPALQLHKDAGFNMIRNWTGETTEELFYALCDEYGMLVWNDFWLSTEGVNQNANDEKLFIDNARETVKRFRNHPSIAVWCPRNEGYAPASLNNALVEIVTQEDGTRHYNPNSRYMNLRTSGPWHHLKDVSDYYVSRAHGFSTELGAPSIPTAESMAKFIPESDRWPISDTWHYHDLHWGLPEYCNEIDRQFGVSHSMNEFCKKAQVVNYERYRAMFESWNSRLWDSTTGVLLWMSHPAWPSVQWQTYSWDFETPGAYFGSKKACEPIHIQRNPHDGKVLIVNLSPREIRRLKAVVSRYTLAGKKLFSTDMRLDCVPANAVEEVTTLPTVADEQCMIERLELFVAGKRVSTNDYLVSPTDEFHALNTLPPVALKARLVSGNDSVKVFEIRNPSAVAAVSVKFNIRRLADGAALLPAFFDDGYINLLPGERRRLTVACDDFDKTVLSAEGYNVNRQNLLKF